VLSLLFCFICTLKNEFCDNFQNHLGDLLDKQRADKAALLSKVDMMSDDEKKELTRSVDAQCQIEQDDLSYRLKLEQDEEAEKIRKVNLLRICEINSWKFHKVFKYFCFYIRCYFSIIVFLKLLATGYRLVWQLANIYA